MGGFPPHYAKATPKSRARGLIFRAINDGFKPTRSQIGNGFFGQVTNPSGELRAGDKTAKFTVCAHDALR
jgi:hypothetical protein